MKLRRMLVLLLVVIAVLGVAAYQTIKWAQGPVVPPEQHPPSKVVVIPDGSTFQQIAALLERERLIKSRTAFVLIGRSQSADRKIRAGEYELNPAMVPAEILSKLLNGQVVLHPITIPEGLTMTQIADLMAQQGVADRGRRGAPPSCAACLRPQPSPPEPEDTPNTGSAAIRVRQAKAQPIFKPVRMAPNAAGIRMRMT